MSEHDPNLPPPPQMPGGYPLPQPCAPPIPVQTLSYTMPMPSHARPGVLSVIGVFSIIIACVTAIGSLVGGCSTGVTFIASRAASTMRAQSTSGNKLSTAKGQVAGTSMNSGVPTLNIETPVCLFAALDAVLGVLLAVLLFVSAIAVRRNASGGRRLHLAYAVLKIPVAIGGGMALATVLTEFFAGIGGQVAAGGPEMIEAGFVFSVVVICGGGLIYPIALLIAMNTRGVRAYYNAVR